MALLGFINLCVIIWVISKVVKKLAKAKIQPTQSTALVVSPSPPPTKVIDGVEYVEVKHMAAAPPSLPPAGVHYAPPAQSTWKKQVAVIGLRVLVMAVTGYVGQHRSHHKHHDV